MWVESTLAASTHTLYHCSIALVASAFWPCLVGLVAPRRIYEIETSLWEKGWWHLTSWRRDSPSMALGKPWRAFPGLGQGHQVTRMRWEQEGSRSGSSPMLLRDNFFICVALKFFHGFSKRSPSAFGFFYNLFHWVSKKNVRRKFPLETFSTGFRKETSPGDLD